MMGGTSEAMVLRPSVDRWLRNPITLFWMLYSTGFLIDLGLILAGHHEEGGWPECAAFGFWTAVFAVRSYLGLRTRVELGDASAVVFRPFREPFVLQRELISRVASGPVGWRRRVVQIYGPDASYRLIELHSRYWTDADLDRITAVLQPAPIAV